jgi:CrcB protein
VNVAGSLLLGLLLAQGRGLAPEVRDALGVGFLGGFTTFSTFSLQAVLEADAGRPGTAAAYVGASVVLGVGAACAGFYGGRAL